MNYQHTITNTRVKFNDLTIGGHRILHLNQLLYLSIETEYTDLIIFGIELIL